MNDDPAFEEFDWDNSVIALPLQDAPRTTAVTVKVTYYVKQYFDRHDRGSSEAMADVLHDYVDAEITRGRLFLGECPHGRRYSMYRTRRERLLLRLRNLYRRVTGRRWNLRRMKD